MLSSRTFWIKNLRFLPFIIVFCCFSSISFATDYSLNTGDKISIKVYGEPDLTINVKIDKTGVISFPCLQDINVIGLSTKK